MRILVLATSALLACELPTPPAPKPLPQVAQTPPIQHDVPASSLPFQTKAIPDSLERAQELREAGMTQEALDMLERLAHDAAQRGDALAEATAIHKSGDVLQDFHDYPKALDGLFRYERAYETYLQLGAYQQAGLAANDRCISGVMEERLLWCGRAVHWGRTLEDDKRIRISANNLGIGYENAGDWRAAERSFEEALGAAKTLHDDSGERKVEANLANLYVLKAHGHFPKEPPLSSGDFDLDDAPDDDNPRHHPADLAKARTHYALALAAANRAGEDDDYVCEVFNDDEDCALLRPKSISKFVNP